MHCHIGKGLTIQCNILILHSRNEFRIGKSMLTNSCINADNPQSAEITLIRPAVPVGILPCFLDCIFCCPEVLFSRTIISLCQFDNFAVSAVSWYCTVCSGHDSLLFMESFFWFCLSSPCLDKCSYGDASSVSNFFL